MRPFLLAAGAAVQSMVKTMHPAMTRTRTVWAGVNPASSSHNPRSRIQGALRGKYSGHSPTVTVRCDSRIAWASREPGLSFVLATRSTP